MLRWLDPDCERAAEKYEVIRSKLIRMFARKGCWMAEELTDITMTRVANKVHEIAPTYIGNPALYFYGVAQNVYREWLKWLDDQRKAQSPPPPDTPEVNELRLLCLDGCLEKLDPDSREFIIEYYRADKRAKIDCRKALADRFGVALNAIRMRAHRTKATLHQCIKGCLAQPETMRHGIEGAARSADLGDNFRKIVISK
ncbi:MAG: hypothetical protein DMF61_02560 [Blastocatellia bacterium AA13]|nr:MAG: hypothetical protein DMF61_02560 [Blastocatellia bacterium AA13]